MSATKTKSDLTYTEHPEWMRGETLVHRILVITYFDGEPGNVVTDHGDFSFADIDGSLYFHNGGGGMRAEKPIYHVGRFVNPDPPPCKIWVADEVSLCQWKSDKERDVPVDNAELPRLGYVRLKKPLLLKRWMQWKGVVTRNPFEVAEEHEGHFEYCSICKKDQLDDSLCNHLHYSEGACEVIGAGGDDPPIDDFFNALDWLSVYQSDRYGMEAFLETNAVTILEGLLRTNKFPPNCHVGGIVLGDAEDSEGWDDMEAGFAWLQTLDKATKEASAKTLAWIKQWRRTAGKRAKEKERKKVIAELQSLVTDENREAIIKALGLPGKDKKKELDAVPVEKIRAVVEQFAGSVHA